MSGVPYMSELAVVALVAVVVTVVLVRARLPAVAGLLAAGALAGPAGLGLVHSTEAIEGLAEVGVVLLLFTIGLEFSVKRLAHLFRQVALGGTLQVLLTAAVVCGVAVAFGATVPRAVFYGFVFALSSTAIVLRALADRRELDAPHGRFIVGTLIFQDLCVVPMVLVVPLLGAAVEPAMLWREIGLALGKAALMVVATLVVSRVVVPRALLQVAKSRSRETFLLAIIGLCIGTAWLTAQAGLSLALGAFLGGMVVADTEYGHRALGDLIPLRDVFVSLFFVSLGMLFDIRTALADPLLVTLLLAGFLLLKGLLATTSAMLMRFPARVAWLAGVGLAQFGEFGFVLTQLGVSSGVVDQRTMQPVLAAGIISMFLTPLMLAAAPHVRAGEKLLAPLERMLGVRAQEGASEDPKLAQHVVLVGYGLAGRLAGQCLTACGLRYVALELNLDTVRKARAQGLPVRYADATSEEALRSAGFSDALALVLLMNDPQAARRVVDNARRLAPAVPVLMRTRYHAERGELLAGGANDVVVEEVEGAVEVLARMLRWLEVPRDVIDQQLHDARANTQTTARSPRVPRHTLAEHKSLDELKIESTSVAPHSHAVGRSAVELELRSRTGALVVAVRRGERLLEQPDPTTPFEAGDVAYLVGRRTAVEQAVALLSGSSGPPEEGRPEGA